MNILIKFIIIISLSSCSTLNIFVKSDSLNEQITDKFFYNSLEDEVLLVAFSKKESTLFKLTKTDKYKKTWSDGIRSIETINGKIISSYKFKNNIKLIANAFTDEFFYKEILINTNIRIFSDFRDSNYLHIQYLNSNAGNKNYINAKGRSINTTLYKERYEVRDIKWEGDNLYWINKEGEVVKSKQSLSPFGPTLLIDHIKK